MRGRTLISRNRQMFLGIALTGIAVTTGCAVSPPGPTVQIEKPKGIDTYVAGVSALKGGDESKAIEQLQASLEENPTLRMAHETLGELFLKRKQFADALPHFQAASELDPYTIRNHYNLGLSFQALSRFQESALAYLDAIRLDPNDFGSNMNLGIVYYALHQFDDAVAPAEKATRVNTKNAQGWSNLGVVYDAVGNLVRAEACYRTSLEINPDSVLTLQNLTANLIDQKKPVDAVAFAKQLVQKNDDAANWKRLGDAQTLAKDWTEAIRAYDVSFSKTRTYLPAVNAKGNMYLARYHADLDMDDSLRQLAVATWKQSLAMNANQPAVSDLVKHWENPGVTDRR